MPLVQYQRPEQGELVILKYTRYTGSCESSGTSLCINQKRLARIPVMNLYDWMTGTEELDENLDERRCDNRVT